MIEYNPLIDDGQFHNDEVAVIPDTLKRLSKRVHQTSTGSFEEDGTQVVDPYLLRYAVNEPAVAKRNLGYIQQNVAASQKRALTPVVE